MLFFLCVFKVGPFIAMLPGLFTDVIIWAFVLSIFFLGFAYGLNFIIASDVGTLDSWPLVFEYVFISIFGANDWGVLDENYNDDGTGVGYERSILLKVVMWIFAILGTIIMVNLLIAMMASTYENLKEDRTKYVNFARAAQIYSSAYRYAIIPPPLNLVVYIIGIFWGIYEGLVICFSCATWMVNLRFCDPITVNYHSTVGETNHNAKPKNLEEKFFKCCIKVKPGTIKRVFRSKDDYKRSAKYCRFCRCYMSEHCPGILFCDNCNFVFNVFFLINSFQEISVFFCVLKLRNVGILF